MKRLKFREMTEEDQATPAARIEYHRQAVAFYGTRSRNLSRIALWLAGVSILCSAISVTLYSVTP